MHLNHTNASHRLMGMDPYGFSFNCAQCGKIAENKLPIRRGHDGPWFCCIVCAFAYFAARGSMRDYILLMLWASKTGDCFDKVAYQGRS